MNWRGRPLVSHEVIVNLIASTKTRSGLKVRAELDNADYPKGLVVSDEDFAAIKIESQRVPWRLELPHSLWGKLID